MQYKPREFQWYCLQKSILLCHIAALWNFFHLIEAIIVQNKCHQPLHWRHNDHDGNSNHQPHGCLLNRLFRRRSKKTSKFRVTGLCVGNSPGPVNSPHKGPVTRKMFPFDDVIMWEQDSMPSGIWGRFENALSALKSKSSYVFTCG